METEIITALIAAIASLLVSVFLAIRGQRNQEELETLKNRLTEQQAERDARRDYEYGALQRLYEEYEPLRFQLLEGVESAKLQIEELGRQDSIRQQGQEGILPGGNYLLLATIYHLLLPAVMYRIARRKLTLVDLKVDPQIELQSLLMKKAYLAFTQDALMAKFSRLDYTPYVEGWREKRDLNPRKFRRQGLPLGRLDNALDALIMPLTQSSIHERVLTFGEFEEKFAFIKEGDVRSALGAARDLFFEFHPIERPVLWRILLAQYFLYKAIIYSAEEPFIANWFEKPRKWLTIQEAESLQWKPSPNNPFDPQNLESAYEAAEKYLQEIVVPDVQRILRKGKGVTRH